jgi:hypothetical protein
MGPQVDLDDVSVDSDSSHVSPRYQLPYPSPDRTPSFHDPDIWSDFESEVDPLTPMSIESFDLPSDLEL